MRALRKTIFLLIVMATIILLHNSVTAGAEDYGLSIEDPLYSIPAVTVPGGRFNVTLTGTIDEVADISALFIVAPGYNYTCSYNIELTNETSLVLSVEVPENTTPELYDIYLKIQEGNKTIVLHEPRSLWVLSEYPSTIRFLHYTDIHIGIRTDNVWTYEFYYSAINLANMLPVDFVVITGDDIDVGSDIASLKLFRTLTNFMRKPTFIIPGNHDHAGVDTITAFEEKYYGKYIGRRYWYRIIGKFLLIGLDTGSYGYLDDAQLKWLEKILEKYNDKVKIILTHHPLFGYDARGYISGTWKEFNKLYSLLYPSWQEHSDSAKEFLRLIEEYNVTMALAGHIHTDRVVIYNNRTYFITTTTTCAGRRESDYRGFRIIEVTSNGRVLKYYEPSRNPFQGMNSYNIEVFETEFKWPNNFTYFVNYMRENNKGWLDISNATLYLYVNRTLSKNEYKIFGNNTSITLLPYGDYWLIKATNISVLPGELTELVVSPFIDNDPPTISMIYYTPRNPPQRSQVTFLIKVEDKGWGVRKVEITYTYMGTNRTIPTYFDGKYWSTILPPLPGVENTTIIVVAEDFAGNRAVSEPLTIKYLVPSRTTTTQITITTTTEAINTSTTTTNTTTTTTRTTTTTPTTMTKTQSAVTGTTTTSSTTTTSLASTTTSTTEKTTEIIEITSTTQVGTNIDYTVIIVLVVALVVGGIILYFIALRR